MNVKLIPEESYREAMEQTVLPYLAERRTSGTFERIPGEFIWYELYNADAPKADIVIVHGYSSVIPKFYECIWYFLTNGFNVRILEQRGHGRSVRETLNPDLIHITDYRDLILDLRYFVKHIVIPGNTEGLPMYLFGHSMGGAVSACYLGHYPHDFKKAVLTSPMLAMETGDIPVFGAFVLADVMIRFGKGEYPMPGSAPFSEEPDFRGSVATSEARYQWFFEIQKAHPEFRMCRTTYQTAMQLLRLSQEAMREKNLHGIRVPVLLFQAEHDVLVKADAQDRFVESIPNGRLVRVEGAKHEIYRSDNRILTDYWKEILDFLS